MNKYEMTEETMSYHGRTLHRIRALIDMLDENGEVEIHAGELGGWIENEENLEQDGGCWVCSGAIVYDGARVHENARVCDAATIFGNALICDDAVVRDGASVSGNAMVSGNALVSGHATVRGDAWIGDNATVSGNAVVSDSVVALCNATVSSYACVGGNAQITRDAVVTQNDHYLTIGFLGDDNNRITFTRDAAGTIQVRFIYWFESLLGFRDWVEGKYGNTKHGKVLQAAADLAELQIDTTPIEEAYL